MTVADTTDASFSRDVLESDRPVIVDFWAPWCGPCKALAPALEALAGDLAKTVAIVKLDIDANAQTPARYQVRSVPTLVIFKNGAVVATKVGIATRDQLRRWIDSVVN